jgi:hypothetical protein
MSNEIGLRVRYGEAFWQAHHEAWQQGALNQREYCEAHGIPLKAFGNWRAKFKAEPQLPVCKLLYRRRGLSHSVSHSLSHMAYGCAEPIVPPVVGEIRRPPPIAANRNRILWMSAFHPGADIAHPRSHVSFVPKNEPALRERAARGAEPVAPME